MIYALDGCDAAGKATQARILADKIGCSVISFPDYDSPTGRLIQDHLAGKWSTCKARDPYSEQLRDAAVFQTLMTINRFEKYDRLALCAGSHRDHVVLDRYVASALAYGLIEDLDPTWLELIHRGLPEADYCVLIDLDPRIGAERRAGARDRNERNMEKLKKVRGAYLGIFTERMKNSHWTIVDGSGSIANVAAQIADACALGAGTPKAKADAARKHLAQLEQDYATWIEQKPVVPGLMTDLDNWIERLGVARSAAQKADREFIATQKK